MGRNWTEEQKKVIELHDRNILVSAAAGSGKTAVLVERIINMVTDPSRDADVDRLVVVTFTKAAAGEMRERISAAFEDKLEKDPDNAKLQKQLTLIHNAQITTIDSFCLNIVRNNFASADIDPGFRTADEGELKLLEADVMGKMLEEYYDSDRQDFFDFVDSYGTGRSDVAIEDLIYRVYSFSRSYPWPELWFEECREPYRITAKEMLYDNRAVEFLKEYIIRIFADHDFRYAKLEETCAEADGPSMYAPMIASDHDGIKRVLALDTFEDIGEALRNITFDRLSSKKDANADPGKKEYVKNCRDAYKDSVKNLQGKVFRQTAEQNFEDIMVNMSSMNILIELAERFYKDMQEAKRDKNIIDFNDMEHLALDVLVKFEDGKRVYSEAADRLSEFYEEILIDEYQDSNMLQEEILRSISRGRFDESRNNMFMVGDVKQSIYKFRLARPDIFIGKYNEYTDEDSSRQKIELKKNFRSRDNVLKSINDVFFNIMKDYFGGIEYNENVMLNTGLEFPEAEENERSRTGGDTEVIIIGADADSEDEEELESRELEAEKIALRIRELTDPETGQLVFDAKKKEYRPAQYRDIVVLTRTIKGWADTFVDTLLERDIPAFADSSSGYFNTREIKLILSLLAVIDNPVQDIPLAAVLTSYFGNITDNELADIRKTDRKVRLYNTICGYIETGDDRSIVLKLEKFMDKLEKYRKMAIYTDIHDLIWKIVYDTGYYDYVGTMPAGVKRQANLDMLIEKAKAYEGTSYRGLFNFLRYIDKLKKYEVDYGEATILGENENLVRIMSIHKSKGLEFPIVILAGMGKEFNNMDTKANVVIDPELGIGANAVDLGTRTKSPTIIKNAVALKMKLENMSEEMRILYVAMTRAKEKLIMTGTPRRGLKAYDEWLAKAELLDEEQLPYSFAELEGCKSYFDLVVPTAAKKTGVLGQFRVSIFNSTQISDEIRKAYGTDENHEATEATETPKMPDRPESSEESETVGVARSEGESAHVAYVYPYAEAAGMKSKVTVSELKRMQHEPEEETAVEEEPLFEVFEEEPAIVPKFISGEQVLEGSSRGTAYHRVMECLDYAAADSAERIAEFLEELVISRKITRQQKEAVEPEKIYRFCRSGLGSRIMEADGQTGVRREQQFVYGIAQPEADNTLLVQGVIDLYFEEAGKLILVDYKTDRVPHGKTGAQILTERYKVQLDYYADALSRLTGMEVSEKIIWSFECDEAFVL